MEQALALRTGRAATGVVMGGDKSLSAAVLADRRLERLAKLPRREFFDIPDPRLSVLHSVADRARSVSITVSNMSA